MPPPIALGPISIQRIIEKEVQTFDAKVFFPTLTPEIIAEHKSWLDPHHLDPAGTQLNLCIQGYLLRTPHHTILVDSCVGNHKPRPNGPRWHMWTGDRYEKNLAAAGVRVEDIDYVMCTHLHVDHVGWNTRLENGQWVPTFPNAKYVFADRELAFWIERHTKDPSALPHLTDSVLPIIAAKREEIVKSNHELGDHVRLLPTPGHTIDHFSVHVGANGQDALITGDMVHSPLQIRMPDLGMASDYDSALAGRTRRHVFERFADTPTLLCPAHFLSPSTGRIVSDGRGFRFVETGAK